MVEGIHGPSFHNMLAIQPHHPQSTKPYISEGGYVMEWHSLAVASASATETRDITTTPLKRIFEGKLQALQVYTEAASQILYTRVWP